MILNKWNLRTVSVSEGMISNFWSTIYIEKLSLSVRWTMKRSSVHFVLSQPPCFFFCKISDNLIYFCSTSMFLQQLHGKLKIIKSDFHRVTSGTLKFVKSRNRSNDGAALWKFRGAKNRSHKDVHNCSFPFDPRIVCGSAPFAAV